MPCPAQSLNAVANEGEKERKFDRLAPAADRSNAFIYLSVNPSVRPFVRLFVCMYALLRTYLIACIKMDEGTSSLASISIRDNAAHNPY